VRGGDGDNRLYTRLFISHDLEQTQAEDQLQKHLREQLVNPPSLF
jgi:hypothetical protein